jgi:hypothetical protein
MKNALEEYGYNVEGMGIAISEAVAPFQKDTEGFIGDIQEEGKEVAITGNSVPASLIMNPLMLAAGNIGNGLQSVGEALRNLPSPQELFDNTVNFLRPENDGSDLT